MARMTPIVLLSCVLIFGCDKQKSQHNSENNGIFAGLYTTTNAKSPALPSYIVEFPKDHNSHPDFAIEWWYLTAILNDTQGNRYPLQWTLFRFASGAHKTPWAGPDQFMAHAKLATKNEQWFEQRFARSEVGNAAVTSSPFSAFIDDWIWQSESSELLPANLTFTINQQITINIDMIKTGPYILQGQNGYSQKLGQTSIASHYYSQPFIKLAGHISIADQTFEVSGQGWFDHEWSSQMLDEFTLGWDWFSLHLGDGKKLMLFRMRHQQFDDFWSAKLMYPNGESVEVKPKELSAHAMQLSTVEGKALPLHWSIEIAKHGINIRIKPFKLNQWNAGAFPYYEGAVDISGSHTGEGFIELTGY